RETLAKAALFAGMSVQDAFRVLWEELPCSRRLVEGAGLENADDRRDLDTVVTFANAVAEASEGGDTGVQGFLEALDAGEHGPGWTAWDRVGPDAVAVLTAHGTVGLEFDTVIVAGAAEGNFPSLGRPEPMFDLASPARRSLRGGLAPIGRPRRAPCTGGRPLHLVVPARLDRDGATAPPGSPPQLLPAVHARELRTAARARRRARARPLGRLPG